MSGWVSGSAAAAWWSGDSVWCGHGNELGEGLVGKDSRVSPRVSMGWPGLR